MKKFFYLAAVAVTALFSACSDSSIVPEQGKDWTDCFDADGHAYLKFAITTPTSGSTRASYDVEGEDYGNYANGTETEVKKAYLAIYGQKYAHDAEANFTCLRVYELGEMTWNENANAWITKDTKKNVVQINEQTAVGNVGLWALVILNPGEGDWALPAKDDKFEVWRNAQSEGRTGLSADFSETGFYMTNMPYTDAYSPSATTVKALYPIKLDGIKKTYDEALNALEPATTVNVERGVAKVEVLDAAAEKKIGTDGPTYTFDSWFVDNYNTGAYNIRHCALPTAQYTGATNYGYLNYNLPGKTNPHRFVFSQAITPNAYRTAWAVDANYNDDATLVNQAELLPGTSTKVIAVGSGKYIYFHENTFDVAHQTEPNTTRVIIPAVFNGGNGFYTLDSDPDKVYPAEDAKNRVYEMLGANPEVTAWGSENLATTVALNKILDVALTTDAGKATVTVTPKATKPSDVTLKDGHDWASFIAAFPNVASYITAHETFTYYVGGKAYYSVLIQHFGAHDTPWQAKPEMTSNTPALIYGYTAGNEATAELNYLGRYGAVRNNWYKISVTGVSKIGSATVPEITGNTDDKVEAAFINYTINMVPWVIRTQTAILH